MLGHTGAKPTMSLGTGEESQNLIPKNHRGHNRVQRKEEGQGEEAVTHVRT